MYNLNGFIKYGFPCFDVHVFVCVLLTIGGLTMSDHGFDDI